MNNLSNYEANLKWHGILLAKTNEWNKKKMNKSIFKWDVEIKMEVAFFALLIFQIDQVYCQY